MEENVVCRGGLVWGRCLCLEANMDTDALLLPDRLPPLAGPHMAGAETTGDLWEEMGVAFCMHPLGVHTTEQELQPPGTVGSTSLGGNEALRLTGMSSQNKGLWQTSGLRSAGEN